MTPNLEKLMQEATPAPYTAEGASLSVKAGYLADVRDPHDYLHQTPTSLANAKLIALAVNKLGACVKLLERTSRFPCQFTRKKSEPCKTHPCMTCEARALLASIEEEAGR